MKKPKKETAEGQSIKANPLSPSEKKLLQDCESKIASSEKSYIVVGEALKQIKDEALHKGTHTSFDDYCVEKWEFSGSHARRLIAAAELVIKLRGAKVAEEQLPRNEHQARLVLQHRPESKHWVRTWLKILKEVGDSVQDLSSSVLLKLLTGKENSISRSKKSNSTTARPEPVITALKLIGEARTDIKERAERDWKKFLDDLEKLLKQVS